MFIPFLEVTEFVCEIEISTSANTVHVPLNDTVSIKTRGQVHKAEQFQTAEITLQTHRYANVMCIKLFHCKISQKSAQILHLDGTGYKWKIWCKYSIKLGFKSDLGQQNCGFKK